MKYKFFIIIIITGLFPFSSVFGYGNLTTHPALTNEIVNFYNLFNTQLTAQEKEWVIQGSIDEDTPPRWINHFYDPTTDEGWSGEKTGIWPTIFMKYLSKALLSNEKPRSLLDWVHNQKIQAEYGKYKGNRTWERAIYEYANGNKQEALYTLGFILHLAEDATVPAHTRNDTHAHELQVATFDSGSPYEEFDKKFTRNRLDIAKDIKDKGYIPVKFDSIDEYLINLATYSNNYFFSKDTIDDKKYGLPKIIKEKNGFGYGRDKNGQEFELVKIKRNKIGKYEIRTKYELKDKNFLVLSQYFNRLSREAVINGAGIIELFLQQAENAKNNPDDIKLPKEKSGIWSAVGNIFSFFVTIGNAKKKINNSLIKIDPKTQIAGPVSLIQKNEKSKAGQGNFKVKIKKSSTIKKKDAKPIIPKVVVGDGGKNGVDDGGTRAVGARQSQSQPKFYGTLISIPSPGYGGGGGVSQPKVLVVVSPPPVVAPSDTIAPAPPVVTSPSDFTKTFTTSSILFSGTSEATSTISTDFSLATTTTDNTGKWNLNLTSFSEGTTSVRFFATDEAGNVSQATTTTLFVNSNAPDVLLTIEECQNSLSQNECLVATTTLSISWNSSASDLNNFIINKNGVISATTATSTNINVADNSQYIFSVSSVDTAGNSSATSTQTVTISTMPVVINEVAWAGTGVSYYNDEWVELYNNTKSDIDLNNWTLYAEDKTPYISLSGIIPANGYYLIERNNDNTVSDIPADLIYGNNGADWALNNTSAEHLILAYNIGGATTTVDQIAKCSNWCNVGSSSYYKTMERYDTLVSGTDWNNWGTALGEFILNGENATSSPIYGTPKAKNSISYQITNGAILYADKTLKKSSSPYLISRGGITVQNGVTLTVDPGVVIKFVSPSTPSLSVNGTIISNGTDSDKIVFTSFSDDSYGGDMNGGGASTTPIAGSWKQIALNNSSQDSSFKNTVIRYGGKWSNNDSFTARSMFFINNNDIVFQNNIVEYSGGHGMSLSSSTSTISSNIFRYNNYSNSYAGLYGGGGASTISDNTFDGNNVGLQFSSEDDSAVVRDNTFINNSYRAISVSGNKAGYYWNNSGNNNGINGIVLSNNVSYINTATSTLHKNGLPYYINSSGTKVFQDSTLSIDPGVVVKFNGKWMNVFGNLYINGTVADPVIFTSASDDSDGNDMMNDGGIKAYVAVGNVVYLKNGATSEIKNTEFRFMKTALSYDNSPIYLDGVTFSNNELGVSAGPGETILKANNIIWTNNTNTATSTIPL